ncbi:MAG: adenylyl-sulfate kinase [Alphaproteobacteria bacterium]|nr:adenylyl-sulfate kinase [Alphaproteobacteria bacterium]
MINSVIINKAACVIWLTGMSGSGKTTLANGIKSTLETQGYNLLILDGDKVRGSYKKKLGFTREDIFKNNIRIAQKCLGARHKHDVIIVPVISPYEKSRAEVRKLLEPNFHLIYLKTNIESLKERDPKGLYSAADSGLIKNLIGYCDSTPYEEPNNCELVIDTSKGNSVKKASDKLYKYINSIIIP